MGEVCSLQCIFCGRTAFEAKDFLQSSIVVGLGMCGDCLTHLANEFLVEDEP